LTYGQKNNLQYFLQIVNLSNSLFFAKMFLMSISGKTILTGDRPTGRLHLGHLVGSIQNRVALQSDNNLFYMIADSQALTDNAEHPEKVRANVIEVALDNMAAGLDPSKATFFIQSTIPEIAELALYFLNLVTVARLERNPTVKDEMKQKGFGASIPAGFFTYPVSQAADILCVKATRVPVGADQIPMIEQTNDILDSFNRIYGQTFEKVEIVASDAPRLVGTDGQAKMSKSLGNTIFLADSADEVEKKVMNMYTDPNHIHVADPGTVEGNTVFEYLDIFDPKKDEVAEFKKAYRKGGLGDVVIKKRLTNVLNAVLAPIRERRAHLATEPDAVMSMLKEGSEKTRKEVQKTMADVKAKMKIDYFN
jgi:tryptophanyl-tRNA synthetase